MFGGDPASETMAITCLPTLHNTYRLEVSRVH